MKSCHRTINTTFSVLCIGCVILLKSCVFQGPAGVYDLGLPQGPPAPRLSEFLSSIIISQEISNVFTNLHGIVIDGLIYYHARMVYVAGRYVLFNAFRLLFAHRHGITTLYIIYNDEKKNPIVLCKVYLTLPIYVQ